MQRCVHEPSHDDHDARHALLRVLDLSISQSASAVANRHIGPPRARVTPRHSPVPFWSCRVRVSQNTDGATSLHKTLIVFLDSQCSGLIRRGATRLTSDLESRGAPRGDSTYQSHSVSVAAGEGGG